MKKTVALALLGLAAVTTAYGQGGINIGNYTAPFNPVVWDTSLSSDGAVASTDGVQLTLWYGAGVGAAALTDSMPLAWKLDSEALGYKGYYALTLVTLTDWTPGALYSFQVRASGDSIHGPVTGASTIWQEQANIGNIAPDPITGIPGLPGISSESIGLIVVAVPEPSTFALAGLGAAALLAFRRRD